MLLAAAVASGAAAIWRRGDWVEIHLLADALLIFYLALLFEMKRRREERVAKVRPIAPRSTATSSLDSLRAGGGQHP